MSIRLLTNSVKGVNRICSCEWRSFRAHLVFSLTITVGLFDLFCATALPKCSVQFLFKINITNVDITAQFR